jgi:hypothetical protein
VLSYAVGRPLAVDTVLRAAVVSTVGLLWFARLEPAHQLLSIQPHLGRSGVVELTALLILSAAAMLIPARFPAFTRWTLTLAILAGGSAAMAAAARAIEPAPGRDSEMARLAGRFPDGAGRLPAGHRVLVIGIDGLEWRTVVRMLERGRMPRVAALLGEGRFYQHDNGRLGYSAAIWTGVYSGRPPLENQIDDFVKWKFAGVGPTVTFLPRYGMHALLFLDEWMKRTELLGLWEAVSIASLDSPPPPVWTVASRAGRRVGVFDPLPYPATPEAVNGFFVEAGDGGRFAVYRGDSRAVEEIHAQADDGEFADAGASAAVAAELFARDRPDLGVFYTHFVDTTSHLAWSVPDASFDDSPIRRAYDAADRMIGSLVDAFGAGAQTLMVSDHGWTYDDYEHFNSPNGALIVSPSPQRGYGGVVETRAIAPMILDGLAISAADPAEARSRTFIAPRFADDERQQRLRSLGYLTGTRVKRP